MIIIKDCQQGILNLSEYGISIFIYVSYEYSDLPCFTAIKIRIAFFLSTHCNLRCLLLSLSLHETSFTTSSTVDRRRHRFRLSPSLSARSGNMSLISLCFEACANLAFWLVISQIVCLLLLWGMIVSKWNLFSCKEKEEEWWRREQEGGAGEAGHKAH